MAAGPTTAAPLAAGPTTTFPTAAAPMPADASSVESRAAGPTVAPEAPRRLSPGCHAPAVAEVPERLNVDGRERVVLSRAPEAAEGGPHDLVIAFHGRTNDAAQARRYFRLDAALPHAVLVYPQALAAGPGTFAWGDPGDPPDALRDFALVEATVDAFGRARCLDLNRVFVVGHSLGAYFANDVACALGDRIRAVASVAGGLQGASCVAPTAALLIHHPDDALVPIASGERAREAFLGANGAAGAPTAQAAHPALAALRCVQYGDADTQDPVVWCAHDDPTTPTGRHDAHAWPAGTAAAIAAFFRGLP